MDWYWWRIFRVTEKCWIEGKVTYEEHLALTDWFFARPDEYAMWFAHDGYAGRRYAWGEWRLANINMDWPRALAAVRAELAAAKYPSLDAWLDAHAKGELQDKGAVGGREIARERVPSDVRIARNKARRKRAVSWPRLCTVCNGEFRPTREKAKRCPDCIAGNRKAGRVKSPPAATAHEAPAEVAAAPQHRPTDNHAHLRAKLAAQIEEQAALLRLMANQLGGKPDA